MESITTTTWGYRVVSDTQIAFYHVLLPKIPLKKLKRRIPQIQRIQKHTDGSITLSLKQPGNHKTVVEKIVAFFDKKNQSTIDTLNYHYKMTPELRQLLKEWGLSIEAALGILLSYDKRITAVIKNDWELLNSYVGGLYLSPFTLFFYDTYAKVIHPVTGDNAAIRKVIEQRTASYLRSICEKMQLAKRETIGAMLLSYVSKKTGLSKEKITEIINEKSAQIKIPLHSPLFTYSL